MITRERGVPYFRYKLVLPNGEVFWCFDRKPLEDHLKAFLEQNNNDKED